MNTEWNEESLIRSEDLSQFHKNEDKSEELSQLQEKIVDMERNYISMERYYSQKIKTLYHELNEKDNEYRKLKKELLELRKLGSQHMKKVEDLVTKHKKISPPSRLKSKSPEVKSQQSIGKQFQTLQGEPNSSKVKGKSYSPKNSSKKISPSQKIVVVKKPMFQKTNLSEKQIAVINNKNSSSEKLAVKVEIVKRFSPKRQIEKKVTSKGKPEEKQVKSNQKKTIEVPTKKPTVTSFRERVPIFK